MKKYLPVIFLTILVWGCAKKISPSNAGTSSSGSSSMPAQSTMGKGTDQAMAPGTAAQPVAGENTGTFGSRVPPGATTPEAAAAIAGMATYNTKCGSCHGLKATINHTAEQWASILVVMAPRANLTETEKSNVYAYVKENAKK